MQAKKTVLDEFEALPEAERSEVLAELVRRTTSAANPSSVGELYDRALTLIQYHVELQWLIFGAFLLTEIVLLARIATMLKDHPEPWLFWGAVLGLVVTLPWGTSWSQNYRYYRLRMIQAKGFTLSSRQPLSALLLCCHKCRDTPQDRVHHDRETIRISGRTFNSRTL